jgi:hypothetical protein
MNHEDDKECCFIINISERPYHLRADSASACKDWVITLNRVKEARMHEGNVKLVMPKDMHQPPDLLDGNFTPRVVVVANRQRTHVVEDDDFPAWEAVGGMENPPSTKYTVAPPTASRLARWQKPKTSISRIASKVLAWARSLRNFRCHDADNQVVLDHHLHPPGHDDKVSRTVGVVGHGTYSNASNAGAMHGKPQSGTSVGTDRSPSKGGWMHSPSSTEKSFPREVTTTNRADNGPDDDARFLS